MKILIYFCYTILAMLLFTSYVSAQTPNHNPNLNPADRVLIYEPSRRIEPPSLPDISNGSTRRVDPTIKLQLAITESLSQLNQASNELLSISQIERPDKNDLKKTAKLAETVAKHSYVLRYLIFGKEFSDKVDPQPVSPIDDRTIQIRELSKNIDSLVDEVSNQQDIAHTVNVSQLEQVRKQFETIESQARSVRELARKKN
ncbi:MAG: hypothetical protein AB1489_13300 [Acidobacteriota bacterium]